MLKFCQSVKDLQNSKLFKSIEFNSLLFKWTSKIQHLLGSWNEERLKVRFTDLYADTFNSIYITKLYKYLLFLRRLMSAKTSIQRAMQTAINVTSFKRNLSAKQKNTFTSAALPLGQENYGKVIGKYQQKSKFRSQNVLFYVQFPWAILCTIVQGTSNTYKPLLPLWFSVERKALLSNFLCYVLSFWPWKKPTKEKISFGM